MIRLRLPWARPECCASFFKCLNIKKLPNDKLEEVKKIVNRYAEKLGVGERHLPSFDTTLSDGVFIEYDDYNNSFYYCSRERNIVNRSICLDLDDLLYNIFVSITHGMASSYELEHRRKNEDFRRQMFVKQEELLGILREEWKLRLIKYHQKILWRFPFDDNSDLRVGYYKELRNSGMSPHDADLEAFKKYPLPTRNDTQLRQ